MKGRLLQLVDIYGDIIGLFYTEDYTITAEKFKELFKQFENTKIEIYDDDEEEEFEQYLLDKDYNVERVFIQDIII